MPAPFGFGNKPNEVKPKPYFDVSLKDNDFPERKETCSKSFGKVTGIWVDLEALKSDNHYVCVGVDFYNPETNLRTETSSVRLSMSDLEGLLCDMKMLDSRLMKGADVTVYSKVASDLAKSVNCSYYQAIGLEVITEESN